MSDSDPYKAAKARIMVGYPRGGRTLIVSEALARVAKLAPQSFGGDRIAIAQPMPAPEIEEPIPFAYDGVSARNARRLAKKAKRK